jgi:DNA adenine methylase
LGKTIAVSEDVWAMLSELKLELGARTLGEVVERLLERYFEVEFVEYLREVYGDAKPSKPFGFPGGDWWIKDRILDLISRSGCRVLVEVFGGSGVVSMYAPRNQFKVIVYNDLDGLLTNFFEVLQSRPRELRERVMKLPMSREISAKYTKMILSGEVDKLDPVEKAVVWFYVLNTRFWGKLTAGYAVDRKRSLATTMARRLVALEEIARMWAGVSIENLDFRRVIGLYDSPNTLFYCDPPHMDVGGKGREQYYRFGFAEQDMRDLLGLLDNIKGKFVLKLSSDNLEYDFIKKWADRYKVERVEHFLSMKKVIGGSRPKFITLLIHNF